MSVIMPRNYLSGKMIESKPESIRTADRRGILTKMIYTSSWPLPADLWLVGEFETTRKGLLTDGSNFQEIVSEITNNVMRHLIPRIFLAEGSRYPVR